MNKKIKELVEEALKYEGPNNGYIFPVEKFAELIVKECTNMLPEDSVRDANGVHMFYTIRKHFGVSEIGR